MKITPIEIRQHTFQKTLRGYDVEEVSAFLASLSNEWERVASESKMLKMQLEIAEKELNKLREVELTMFRMLKSAEDTSSQMTEQAKNAAEKYIDEARVKAEEAVTEARKKANMIVVDAENQANYAREETLNEFKNMERDFKAMEKYRDNLLVQLRTLANNTTESVERFEKKFAHNMTKERINELRLQVADSVKPADRNTDNDQQADDEDLPTVAKITEDTPAPEESNASAMAASDALLDTIKRLKQNDDKPEEEEDGNFFDKI